MALAAESTHAASTNTVMSKTGQFDAAVALQTSQAAIGRTVGDHVLHDSHGRPVRLASFRGKPLVISLIYTSCYHICPTTTQHLAAVVRKARQALGDDSFSVISIGFDVANDNPASMGIFAAQQDIDIPGWHFLSIDQVTLDKLAAEVGFIYFATPKGFDHLIQATLLDAEGRIYRQVYDMNFETPMLIEPLKELVFGDAREQSLITHLSNRVRLFCTVYDPKSDSYVFDYSLFIGMLIGLTTLGLVGFLVIREWRRSSAGGQNPG